MKFIVQLIALACSLTAASKYIVVLDDLSHERVVDHREQVDQVLSEFGGSNPGRGMTS
jgi:hypothetical protein